MDAIILAGGKGSRMDTPVPKPLVTVRGKTILEHQLEYLFANGVTSAILSLGHRAEEIREFAAKRFPDRSVFCAVEDRPLGTAGGLKLAVRQVKTDSVLVLNCDDLTDIAPKDIGHAGEHVVCVAHPRLPFGRVLEKDGYAVFEEKPLLPDWISVGWYRFQTRELLERLPDEGSLEYDVFPYLKLRIHYHKSFWQPLNTKKDLEGFEKGVDSGR